MEAEIAVWRERVVVVESQHMELREQFEKMKQEMAVWRDLCTQLSTLVDRLAATFAPVPPPRQPLSPKSLYTDQEAESFLKQCLP